MKINVLKYHIDPPSKSFLYYSTIYKSQNQYVITKIFSISKYSFSISYCKFNFYSFPLYRTTIRYDEPHTRQRWPYFGNATHVGRRGAVPYKKNNTNIISIC